MFGLTATHVQIKITERQLQMIPVVVRHTLMLMHSLVMGSKEEESVEEEAVVRLDARGLARAYRKTIG